MLRVPLSHLILLTCQGRLYLVGENNSNTQEWLSQDHGAVRWQSQDLNLHSPLQLTSLLSNPRQAHGEKGYGRVGAAHQNTSGPPGPQSCHAQEAVIGGSRASTGPGTYALAWVEDLGFRLRF